MPVLGICYGMQTMAQQLGGKVVPSNHREFGYAGVTPSANKLLTGSTTASTPRAVRCSTCG